MANIIRGCGLVTRRGPRRETSWLTIPATATNLEAGAVALVSSLTTAEKARRPWTLIRTQLSVHLRSDQVIADEFQACAVGMCVVSDQSEIVGVTAVPTPHTDAASDLWFLHGWMLNSFAFASGVGFDGNDGQFRHFDSKAMRKVNDDQDVILVLETPGFSAGVQVITAGRVLIKEH